MLSEESDFLDLPDTPSLNLPELIAVNFLVGSQFTSIAMMWAEESISDSDFWLFYNSNHRRHVSWYADYVATAMETNSPPESLACKSVYGMVSVFERLSHSSRADVGKALVLLILGISTLQTCLAAEKNLGYSIVNGKAKFVHDSVLSLLLELTGLRHLLGKRLQFHSSDDRSVLSDEFMTLLRT